MAKVLKVEKAKAVSLFMALGFKTASKWDAKKLHEKINAIEEAPAEPLDDEVLDGLLDEILGSDVIEIIDEEKPAKAKDEDEDEEEKPAKKSKKAAKKEKKAKKEKPAKVVKEKKEKIKHVQHVVTSVDVLKNMKKSGMTFEELVQASKDLYVKHGGQPNENCAAYSGRQAVLVMERLGLISVEGNKIKPVNPA
jgi:outer membrane biosynthesis protein TonB